MSTTSTSGSMDIKSVYMLTPYLAASGLASSSVSATMAAISAPVSAQPSAWVVPMKPAPAIPIFIYTLQSTGKNLKIPIRAASGWRITEFCPFGHRFC